MNLKNEEKWIVGTGFSRGIGKEIIQVFKKKNYKVLHLGRNKSHFEDEFITWDLKNSIVKNPLSELSKILFGKQVAGVFYNAGLMPMLKINDTTEAHKRAFWQSQEEAMRVNYLSCAELIEELLPFLLMNQSQKNQEEVPFVAHMSSLASVSPLPGFDLYGGTKAACLSFFRWLSKRYSADVLTSLSFHPGTVETDMLNDIMLNSAYKDMEVYSILEEEKSANRVISAETAAKNICDFLFKSHQARKEGHGRLYLGDVNKFYN